MDGTDVFAISKDIGQKRGLSAGAGASCNGVPSVDKVKQPTCRKRSKGTYSVEQIPLLLRMNALFNEKIKERLAPGKRYKRQSLENKLKTVCTFAGLCKDHVREYMKDQVREGDSGYSDVVSFYALLPEQRHESGARAIVDSQAEGNKEEWSYWYCKSCNKVTCDFWCCAKSAR